MERFRSQSWTLRNHTTERTFIPWTLSSVVDVIIGPWHTVKKTSHPPKPKWPTQHSDQQKARLGALNSFFIFDREMGSILAFSPYSLQAGIPADDECTEAVKYHRKVWMDTTIMRSIQHSPQPCLSLPVWLRNYNTVRYSINEAVLQCGYHL